MQPIPIESSIQIPFENGAPYKDVRKRLNAAIKTGELIEGISGKVNPINYKAASKVPEVLENIAKGVEPPANLMREVTSTASNAEYVLGMLSQYDMRIVNDAVTLRNYVTNKLIIESDNPDPRIRMQALVALGKITDVGLFTDKSEVTVNNKSNSELETILKEKLLKLSSTKAENTDFVDVPTKIISIKDELKK